MKSNYGIYKSDFINLIPLKEAIKMAFPPKDIMVPLDGSKNAERALTTAIALAKENKARLHLVRVIDPNIYAAYGGGANATVFNEDVRLATENYLEDVAKRVKESGFTNFSTKLLQGNIKSTLARSYPEEHKIDLIMIGATGMNAISQAVMGSITAYVVRHATVNVFVVKDEA
ncbi:universal stress protein [Furfurilactobacillus rossiae]|nr:universal stress protein [Furfurilactobacillus rossiae]